VGLEAPVQSRDEAALEVAVGSTNPAKVEAVRTVFSRAFDGVQVLPVPVALPAAIGEMPVGEQVREGAIYRARAAAAAGGHFGVGLEGGVEFEGEACYLLNWVAVLRRRDGVLSTAPSGKLRLPDRYGRAIRAGRVLGDLMIEKVGRADVNANEGAVGYLTRGLVSRQRFFEEALALALAPFLSPEEYQEELAGPGGGGGGG